MIRSGKIACFRSSGWVEGESLPLASAQQRVRRTSASATPSFPKERSLSGTDLHLSEQKAMKNIPAKDRL